VITDFWTRNQRTSRDPCAIFSLEYFAYIRICSYRKYQRHIFSPFTFSISRNEFVFKYRDNSVQAPARSGCIACPYLHLPALSAPLIIVHILLFVNIIFLLSMEKPPSITEDGLCILSAERELCCRQGFTNRTKCAIIRLIKY